MSVARLQRALQQRLFVIEQDELNFQISGSTGNIYSCKIRANPKCSCPDGYRNNRCKHILYILVKVLKYPRDKLFDKLLNQSILSTCLENGGQQMFAISNTNDNDIKNAQDKNVQKQIGQDDTCPICFDSFDATSQSIVFCRKCGNNIHGICWEQWVKNGKNTCVFCRAKDLGLSNPSPKPKQTIYSQDVQQLLDAEYHQ